MRVAAKKKYGVGVLVQGDEAYDTILAISDAEGLDVAGVALLTEHCHGAALLEDLCAQRNIPCQQCIAENSHEVLQSFGAEAVAAVNLPRSCFSQKLCEMYPDRIFSSSPSLSPFVTGLEDADLVAFSVTSKCRFSGCTVFRVLPHSTSLAGLPSLWPVAAQEVVALEPDETTESLRAKVDGKDCLGKAFVEAIKDRPSGN
jgi:folate-dependent phosphoribosylglycinamide formyltransferase PurN